MASLVFPFHDSKNSVFKFLRQVLPVLKVNFDRAYVSITPQSEINSPEATAYFEKDDFFVVNSNKQDSLVGDHFVEAYRNAVENSKPDEILHLCTSDRLCFALLNYQQEFLQDIKVKEQPVLFVRSPMAWETHPQNYYQAESMVNTAGKLLFGQDLDFAWCHLTLTAGQLKSVIPRLVASDFVVFAQLVFNLRKEIKTKEVEWLSWEDPFILGKNPTDYKIEREKDPAELEKRMSYVVPMIKYLFEEYRKLV